MRWVLFTLSTLKIVMFQNLVTSFSFGTCLYIGNFSDFFSINDYADKLFHPFQFCKTFFTC